MNPKSLLDVFAQKYDCKNWNKFKEAIEKQNDVISTDIESLKSIFKDCDIVLFNSLEVLASLACKQHQEELEKTARKIESIFYFGSVGIENEANAISKEGWKKIRNRIDTETLKKKVKKK